MNRLSCFTWLLVCLLFFCLSAEHLHVSAEQGHTKLDSKLLLHLLWVFSNCLHVVFLSAEHMHVSAEQVHTKQAAAALSLGVFQLPACLFFLVCRAHARISGAGAHQA
jgi:hypothetical protein